MKKHFNELFEFNDTLKMYQNKTPLTVKIGGRIMKIGNITFPQISNFPQTDIAVALVKDKILLLEENEKEIVIILLSEGANFNE